MSSMHRVLLAFLLVVGCSLAYAAEPVQLVPKSLLDGRVSVMVPSTFQQLSRETLLKKYIRPNPPSTVFANERANVSIAFDHTANRITPAQLSEGLEQIKAGIQQSVGGGTWFRSELVKINGRQFALMDVRTPGSDTEIRNLMALTSLEDRLLVVAFNCTRELEEEWLATGNKILQSITIK